MFVYELWVRVVGHEMPWSRVACKSYKYIHMCDLFLYVFIFTEL